MLRRLALSVALLSFACGSDSPTTPSPPVASTPPPAQTPPLPPPATIAQIAGVWTGTFELQIPPGVRQFGTIRITVDQTSAAVKGQWQFTSGQSQGVNPWRGDYTGTLILNASGETRFAGTANIIADIQGGTGACFGSVAMTGPVTSTTMRWEGPNPTFTNCQNGHVGGFVWIVSKQ